ncbi:GAF domain-containing protein [Cellulomonas chitinilytica]|uniref:GAF domain-containing protein n=1 Tax=Cellulomonas chitinilytica TaxID=398759 RepID=A0A919NYY2_9CELL|nr:GAF and ANTAR domain-containing protein [Cellulomonas chitinilytica]GIG20223.1 GAF domain-containing protein [Cellulomonas chitinilytica]
MGIDDLRSGLATAMMGATSALAAADQLCRACVDLLDVDGASISVADHETTRGTFGSSGELSRRLDEFQFTFGEGPCLDAVRHGVPVLVADLAATSEVRWPAFAGALLDVGVRAVFALPVGIGSSPVGALDLFKRQTGPLTSEALTGGLLAAELAALPLLDVMGATAKIAEHAEAEYGWDQLASLERVEVYQATGMIVAALNIGPDEALVRLRGNAYARGITASELAWEILERRLDPREEGLWGPSGTQGGPTGDR